MHPLEDAAQWDLVVVLMTLLLSSLFHMIYCSILSPELLSYYNYVYVMSDSHECIAIIIYVFLYTGGAI